MYDFKSSLASLYKEGKENENLLAECDLFYEDDEEKIFPVAHIYSSKSIKLEDGRVIKFSGKVELYGNYR